MSFFKRVFGKKSKKSTLPEAIQKMKMTESELTKRQNVVEAKIQKEVAAAKKDAVKNKKAALQALKRKKRLERQLQQIDGMITKLEGQRELLEEANINDLAVKSLQSASKSLKTSQRDSGVQEVERILEDLEDQRELAEEIAEAISQPVGFNDSFDEEELEKELKELGGSLEDEAFGEILPAVPQDNVIDESKLIKDQEKTTVPVS